MANWWEYALNPAGTLLNQAGAPDWLKTYGSLAAGGLSPSAALGDVAKAGQTVGQLGDTLNQFQNSGEAISKQTPAGPSYNYQNILDTNYQLPSSLQAGAGPSQIGELDKRLGNIQLDKRGLDAFRERALAQPGTSAWEQMARQRQGAEEMQARDQAAQRAASGTAGARASLAMRGGLSGGARERLAMQGARDLNQVQQGVTQGAQLQRADIGLNAENQRLQALGALPGMELQALQPEFQKVSAWQNMAQNEAQRAQQANQFNISNSLAQKQAEEQAKLQKYQEQMRSAAAEKTASAVEKGGKK